MHFQRSFDQFLAFSYSKGTRTLESYKNEITFLSVSLNIHKEMLCMFARIFCAEPYINITPKRRNEWMIADKKEAIRN